MLATRRTIDALGAQLVDVKGSKVSDFARRQMEKMGWIEGKGLGRNEDGMKGHIKVQKKNEPSGLGLEAAATEKQIAGEDWWHDAFSSNLKTFAIGQSYALENEKKSKKKKKHSKKKSRDDDSSKKNEKIQKEEEKGEEGRPSFDDLFKATGGARLGMRARASQLGKLLRTEAAEIVCAKC